MDLPFCSTVLSADPFFFLRERIKRNLSYIPLSSFKHECKSETRLLVQTHLLSDLEVGCSAFPILGRLLGLPYCEHGCGGLLR